MKNIVAALIKAKANFPAIHKNKVNPHFKNKYASLDSIIDCITKPLGDQGIVLVQPTSLQDGVTVLSTQLIHAETGETIESQLIIPSQSDPQKLGAALTYYRRFSICSILAIAADDDDDGTSAVSNQSASSSGSRYSSKPPASSPSTRTQQTYQKPSTDSSDFSVYSDQLKALLAPLNFSPEDKQSFASGISSQKISEWGTSEWRAAITAANTLTSAAK